MRAVRSPAAGRRLACGDLVTSARTERNRPPAERSTAGRGLRPLAHPQGPTDAVLRRVERGHVRFHRSSDLEAFFADAGLAVAHTRRTLARTYAFLLATKRG
jgi:hypothetical protein